MTCCKSKPKSAANCSMGSWMGLIISCWRLSPSPLKSKSSTSPPCSRKAANSSLVCFIRSTASSNCWLIMLPKLSASSAASENDLGLINLSRFNPSPEKNSWSVANRSNRSVNPSRRKTNPSLIAGLVKKSITFSANWLKILNSCWITGSKASNTGCRLAIKVS